LAPKTKRICMRRPKKDSLKNAHSRVARVNEAGLTAHEQEALDSSFIKAVMNDDTDEAKRLFAEGASLHARSRGGNGWNAMMWACRNGNAEMVDFLLANGVSVETDTIAGFRPLHEAAANEHAEVAKKLLAAGTDVNAKNISDRTALFLSVEYPDILKILLEAGADPEIQDIRGLTPLMMAIKCAHEDGVKTLLAAGVKLDTEDFGGNTAFAYAVVYDDPASMVRLADAGADLTLTEDMGLAPLKKATLHGLNDLIAQLREEALEKELRVFKNGLSRPMKATKPFGRGMKP